MRRILTTMLMLIAVLSAYAAKTASQLYEYQGKSVTAISENPGRDIPLRNGQWLYLAEKPDSSATKIVLLLDGKNTTAFLNVQKIGADVHWFDVLKPVKVKSDKQKPSLEIKPVSDSLCIIRNMGKDTIDIYDNGVLRRTLAPTEELNVEREKSDSVALIVAGGSFKPMQITARFKTVAAAVGLSVLDYILIGACAVLLIALIVVVILQKVRKTKKEDNKEKVQKVPDSYFSIKENRNDNTFLFLNESKDKKDHILIEQSINFSTVEEKDNYAKQVFEEYYQKYKDKFRKRLNAIFNGDNTIKLPVFFSKDKPAKDDKRIWQKVKVDGKSYWVAPLPPYKKPEPVVNNVAPTEKVRVLISELKQLATEKATATDESVSNSGTTETKLIDGVPAEVTDITNSQASNGTQEIKLDDSDSKVESPKTGVLTIEKDKYDDTLSRLASAVDALEDNINSSSSASESVRKSLARENKTLKESNNELNKKIDDLNKTLEKQQKSFKDESEKQQKAFEKEKGDLTKSFNEQLKSAKEEAANDLHKFNSRVKLYEPCQEFAKKAVSFFDSVQSVEAISNELYTKYMESGEDKDGFSYYFARIENKFEKSEESILNLKSHYDELKLLASSGLVRVGGWIDKMLEKEASQEKYEGLLRLGLYSDVMEEYGSAAIIMADEYAYQIPAMVKDAHQSEIKEIATKSEELQSIIAGLGYKITYAKPFTLASKYDNVENVKFADIGAPTDTIIEVLKIAIRYGSKEPKTEVSAQK